jgi:glycosyltransferase involved in cell wall biosynthesis
MAPRFSVVTVTYNSSRFVRQTIESILSQSFTDFEYLISDDCSTDNTWDIIKEYKDSRIKAWKNEYNLGEYANRNKTLFEAKGEYIIWIDGDDILYSHALEILNKFILQNPTSSVIIMLPYRDDMILPLKLAPKEIYLHDFLGSSITIYGFCNNLFKKEALLKINGLPTNLISGDTFIKRKLALTEEFLIIPDGFTWWRQSEGQASRKLKLNYTGALEAIHYNLMLLNHKDCPLDASDIVQAKINIIGGFIRVLIKKELLNFHILRFFKFIKQASFEAREFFYVFKPLSFKYKNRL